MAVSHHDGSSSQIIRACFPESYIAVGALYEFCHVPGKCGKPLECEGQTALIKGRIDYTNIFEHSRYPQLPYEKFFLVGDEGKIVDVLVVSSDNASLFQKIFIAWKEGKQTAYIKGTIRGFDAPVMGTCHREIQLEITSPANIYFR